jgi:hypothetical protein
MGDARTATSCPCEKSDSNFPSADDSDGSSGHTIEIASRTMVDCSPVWKADASAAKLCDKEKLVRWLSKATM